jgi:hypothetical protein
VVILERLRLMAFGCCEAGRGSKSGTVTEVTGRKDGGRRLWRAPHTLRFFAANVCVACGMRNNFDANELL